MARAPRPNRAPTNHALLAFEAVRAGDLDSAFQYFGQAVETDKRNPSMRYNLALAAEQIGEVAVAAREYTIALSLKRDMAEAARRLSAVLRRYRLPDWRALDPVGISAALAETDVDYQPLAQGALSWLEAATPIGKAISEGEPSGLDEAARRLIVRKTDEALQHELLLTALSKGINKDPRWENLLTALRKAILLEVAPERFADRALHTFAVALAEQCLANGYVWAVSEAEEQALASPFEVGPVLAGDIEAAHRALQRMLYAPASDVLGESVRAEACAGIKPRAFRDLVQRRLAEREEEARLAAALPSLGPFADATSERVAWHYGRHPYPRWRSIQPASPGIARRGLQRYFAPERLAFLDGPARILVAGAGTCEQAVDTAFAFGPGAQVLAVDLSRASLAYGQRMANARGVKNLTFAQADLLGLDAGAAPFDIVICSGVLHHVADPLAGWRHLTASLRPGGLMFVGLYSAVARKLLAELRSEPGFPGADCDDRAARAYRQALLARKDEAIGVEMRLSQDFYTMSDYRDLVLHPSEKHLTLPEIEAFMAANGLIFRGFAVEPVALAKFAEDHPQERWPGALSAWWTFEQANSTLFESMYQFWCEKAV
jgi:SAM-dependent methyltransferase